MCLTPQDTPATLCYWVAGQHGFKRQGRSGCVSGFATICSQSSIALSNIFLPRANVLRTNLIRKGATNPHTHKCVTSWKLISGGLGGLFVRETVPRKRQRFYTLIRTFSIDSESTSPSDSTEQLKPATTQGPLTKTKQNVEVIEKDRVKITSKRCDGRDTSSSLHEGQK